MMGNKINELASYVQPLALDLISKANAAGLDVVIIDTGRTADEQTVKISTGVSWTKFSKHEPQPPEMLSEAIDVAPRILLPTKLWSPDSPLWQQLGEIGKSVGFAWGGDWLNHPDPSHFEYVHRPSMT